MEPTSARRARLAEAQLLYGAGHFTPPSHPGQIDFSAWLAERTPDGAPTVRIAAPGARSALELPRVRPPSLSPPRRRSRRRRGTATAVHAAGLVDIEGLTPRQVAEGGVLPATSDRAIRQLARDGRFVAAELGVWPWAVVGGQPLARNWWVDELFALSLEGWALEQLPSLSVRRLPPRSRPVTRLPVG